LAAIVAVDCTWRQFRRSALKLAYTNNSTFSVSKVLAHTTPNNGGSNLVVPSSAWRLVIMTPNGNGVFWKRHFQLLVLVLALWLFAMLIALSGYQKSASAAGLLGALLLSLVWTKKAVGAVLGAIAVVLWWIHEDAIFAPPTIFLTHRIGPGPAFVLCTVAMTALNVFVIRGLGWIKGHLRRFVRRFFGQSAVGDLDSLVGTVADLQDRLGEWLRSRRAWVVIAMTVLSEIAMLVVLRVAEVVGMKVAATVVLATLVVLGFTALLLRRHLETLARALSLGLATLLIGAPAAVAAFNPNREVPRIEKWAASAWFASTAAAAFTGVLARLV
jgi:hypothetical protein